VPVNLSVVEPVAPASGIVCRVYPAAALRLENVAAVVLPAVTVSLSNWVVVVVSAVSVCSQKLPVSNPGLPGSWAAVRLLAVVMVQVEVALVVWLAESWTVTVTG
jgi:hypothetical protein